MQINCSYIISFLYRFQGRKLMFCILFVHLSEMCKLLGYLFLIFYGKKSISSWTSLLSRRILQTRYLYCTDIFKIEGWCFADQLYVYEMCILLDFFLKHQLLWLKKHEKNIPVKTGRYVKFTTLHTKVTPKCFVVKMFTVSWIS